MRIVERLKSLFDGRPTVGRVEVENVDLEAMPGEESPRLFHELSHRSGRESSRRSREDPDVRGQ